MNPYVRYSANENKLFLGFPVEEIIKSYLDGLCGVVVEPFDIAFRGRGFDFHSWQRNKKYFGRIIGKA